jgi:hypothetical protein
MRAKAGTWTQVSNLYGDYEKQNIDALHGGPDAPWWPRHGHSLDAVDVDGDGLDDIMVLAGGYAPVPFNDVWATSDGITWKLVHYAEWSPRAWHATTRFRNTLWIIGGSPLNNEVWYLESIAQNSAGKWTASWKQVCAQTNNSPTLTLPW